MYSNCGAVQAKVKNKTIVINIADIVTIVGLLEMVTHETHGKKVTSHHPESFFVISPFTSFDED